MTRQLIADRRAVKRLYRRDLGAMAESIQYKTIDLAPSSLMLTSMCRLISLLAAVLFALPAVAQSPQNASEPSFPLWELGVGAIGRISTEYPGADSYDGSLSPVPYVKYRGRFIELGGDDAVRLVPFRTDRFELGFSVDSSKRVVNRVTSLGSVLPDLDALVEFGPELIYRFSDQPVFFGWQSPGYLSAILQTRGVFSLDDGFAYEGAVFRPAVRYRQYGVLKPGSRVQLSVGPNFATEGVQDVYYETEGRGGESGYDASGGYLGTEARIAVRYPLTERLQVIGGVSASYLGGAANDDSPLFRSDWDGSAFLGIRISLFQSKTMTTRDR